MNFRLFTIRESNDLTQKEVADILNVSQTSYCRWENGIETIPLRKLISFAKHFNVSLDYTCNLSKRKKKQVKYTYEYNKETIGKNILEFRKNTNISQRKLANFLNTTGSTICAYEQGKTLILTSFLYQICKKYKQSMDELCGIIEKKTE